MENSWYFVKKEKLNLDLSINVYANVYIMFVYRYFYKYFVMDDKIDIGVIF